MRSIVLVLITVWFTGKGAQKDSTLKAYQDTSRAADSVTAIKPVIPAGDSLSVYIRMPDPSRHNQFIDTLLKQYAFNPYLFSYHPLKHAQLRMGKERPSRNLWVIIVIITLLIYTGILNRFLGKDIYNVIQAFYTKRSLAKLSREDSLLTSWAFIGLFSLFGFTIGLYVYQVGLYYHFSYAINGFQLFIACSFFVIALFVLKILLLRIIGFIFDISRVVKEYVSILYLTYFNIAFIFLPVVICFSLFPSKLIPYLLPVSVVLIAIVFLIQYLRSTLNIISDFTFPKIYLFIYLCALEICPVLILIKALNL